MSDSTAALIVFAKVPEPNKVKTRLTAHISPEWAAHVYNAFLLDALDMYTTLGVDVRLYFSTQVDAVPDRFRIEGVSLHEQTGSGLGERMAAAFVETFVSGYKSAVIVGTDHPTLPPSFLIQAFEHLLDPYHVVIGPSDDGGYYLLGMNEYYSELFKDMTYSHDEVFSQTLERVDKTNASLSILPDWYDVDTPDTLVRLIQDLYSSELPLIHTRSILADLVAEYPTLH